ncbi:MAG: ADP-ribosylglycohydrolase family protein, partial [Acidimicrobiaceae bacterium]|nr:ADP-ribosylglycohydrolase family protein [Acidimicrobiaceae bacterium]
EAVDACRYFAGLLVGALRGVDKETLLSEHYSPVEGLWDEALLAPKIAAIAAGSFKHKQPPEIRGTGYVVDTLEAVLWAFFHTEDFREGALKVVHLGQDADTTGAIFGQIAGAHYGAPAIPVTWQDKLIMVPEMRLLADRLHIQSALT